MHEHLSEMNTLVTDISADESWPMSCPILISITPFYCKNLNIAWSEKLLTSSFRAMFVTDARSWQWSVRCHVSTCGFSYWTMHMVGSGKRGGQTDSQCMKVSTSGENP